MTNPTGSRAGRQAQNPPHIFRRPGQRPRHVFDYALSSIRYGEWSQPTTESDTVAVVRKILADSEQAVKDQYR